MARTEDGSGASVTGIQENGSEGISLAQDATNYAEESKTNRDSDDGLMLKGITMLARELGEHSNSIRKDINESHKRAERRDFYLLLSLCGMALIMSIMFAMGGYWVYTNKAQEVPIPVAAVYDSGENNLLAEDLSKQVVMSSGNTILAVNRELDGVKKKLDELLARKPETIVNNYYSKKPVKKSSKSKKKKVQSIMFEGEKLEVFPFVPGLPKPSGLK